MLTEIRVACANDVLRIVEIANQAAERSASNFATEPESVEAGRAQFEQTSPMYPWFVAEHGSVVGFARSGPHQSRGAYAWTATVAVYVDPTHHARGIGRALYMRLISTLGSQGYATLIAGITLPNPASERLHESFGFVRCATFPRVGWKFGRWHDVGYWALDLLHGEAPGAIRKVTEVLGTSGAPT